MSLLDRRRILPATALVAALALAGCGTIPQAGGATAPGSRHRVLRAAVGLAALGGRVGERPAEQHPARPTP